MQRPPQAVPTGAGCPPPLAAPRNTYRRNGPFGREANVQPSVAAGPVQPVTNPFAFGRQALKGPLSGSVPKGNPSATQGFSPVTFPPPAAIYPPCRHAGDSSYEPQPSLPAPVSHSGANSTFSDIVAPASSVPVHVTNNSTGILPHLEHNECNPSGQSHSMGITCENSVGGHQGLTYMPYRPPSEQDISRHPTNPSLPFFTYAQQTGTQWKPAQDSLQGQTCSPCPEAPSQNAFYPVTQSTAGVSQASPHTVPRQSPPQQPVQNAMQVPLIFDASGMMYTESSTQSSPWQSMGVASPRQGQFPQEHFYLQPLESRCDAGHPTIQENSPPAQSQYSSETRSGQCAADADSGRISMFFKGDEAENEEILSSEKTSEAGKADFEAVQQAVGHPYYQPLHAQRTLATAFPQTQTRGNISAETVQKGMDVQHSPRAPCQPQDIQGNKNMACVSKIKAGHIGIQYENVENQEVLPSEVQTQNCSSSGVASDSCKYASLGPQLPKNSIASHAEGGPNLEAPDSLPQPVRPDSSSSNYSSLSHQSLSSSTRPRELGTFIQQESGKPAEDSAAGFFKQIDSSPLEGNASEQNQSKNFCSSLPQVPTPSPPKPMGVFQTSVNSSFEPVRSHGFGVKPLEVDQAKMVVELRENCPNQRITKKSPAMPVISPGNLEQPPDNLETIFMPPQPHPLPLTVAGDAGNGSVVENIQSVPEKKPLSRAQGITKKCESPATTLWAPNELPDFGGNVLLAPAAPAVYVPAKQTVQVVQPPDEGLPGQQPSKPGLVLPSSQAGNASSENLENPPKMGDDEAPHSQASSGYASLLSSPPTEALQNQPILIAQPNQSYSLTQPVNFSLANHLNKNEKNHLAKDPGINNKPLLGAHSSSNPSGDNVPLFPLQSSPVSALTNPNLLKDPPTSSEITSNKSAHFLGQSASHVPLNLASEGTQAASLEGLPPEFTRKPEMSPSGSSSNASVLACTASTMVSPHGNPARSQNGSSGQEPTRALDFTVAKTLEQGNMGSCTQVQAPLLYGGLGVPQPACLGRQMEPELDGQQRFYPQVMQDMQPLVPLDRATPSQQQQQQIQAASASQALASRHSSVPASPAQAPTNRSCLRGPLEESSAHLPTNHGQAFAHNSQATLGHPLSAAATTSLPSALTSVGNGQPAGTPSQQDQQHLPPSQTVSGPSAIPYYYYRHPYDAYPPQYQPPYPPADPRTTNLYYQEDAYGRYDRAFWQYDNAAYRDPGSYRYAEPERPSSRASHTSDRPSSRQGYPEDYYNPKGGWSNYYADYYANPYDYEDPGRWNRYQSTYDARLRDSRGFDQRLWYDLEQNSYQKREAYPYENSHEDHWRYDPRFAGSFEDDLEPRRDPYGDELDRHSVHSEHSGHSLHSSRSAHSHQSSFSSRSQQSQLYRSNHDLTASAYEAANQPASLHAEYSYGGYSSFESQAPFADYGYLGKSVWPAAEQVPSRPLTPEKFSVPHICARFGPGGYLIKVLPNLPSEGQPTLVEICSMEVILQHSSEQEEMRIFPGPLTKDDTHKVDVINFAQNKAMRCSQNETLIDRESAQLLWDFIVLLCRQNGTVVGTDIAELLLRDHKTVWLPGKSPNEANLIDFTNEALEQVEEESGEAQLSFLTDSLIATIDSLEKETERFRELLLYGRKKDALESAMKHGLWGHALLLASKMDSRTHARVMTRFANSLPINDPLQTVYQLMSGRMPAASTCCGDEKWGDWRPHLAMVLSNLTHNMDVELRTITTMGDTLASKGLLDAAHFCYLMAQAGFGVYIKKTSKLVLIGSNHSLPFLKFATNEAIQRTEAYEYAQSLGTQPCRLPNFQVFKFIYACRLAEMGLAAQAFHYCEVISKAVLQSPCDYSPVLISQLIQMSSQLRLFDPQMKEKPEEELFVEPGWLVQLRNLDGQIKEGCIAYSIDRSTPQQYVCSTPSSDLDHVGQSEGMGAGQEMNAGPGNPLLAPLLPTAAHPMQSVQLMPSAPPNILEGSAPLVPLSQPEAPSSVGPGAPFSNVCGAEQTASGQGTAVPPVPPAQTHQEAAIQGAAHESPVWKAGPEPRDDDFYGKMESMGSGRQSRSASQSSGHVGFGRRSRTTSESSVHSIGQEKPNSLAQQPSLPRLPIPEEKETRKEPAPQKRGTWLDWLMRKGKNEAHLPDDKNKSIVWDEKKQRWVNLDEPEEESKPPPPPPTGFPKAPQAGPSGQGGPPSGPVNMFSRRAAGNRGRYVDILNPSGAKPSGAVPAPSDLFAPLAPMPIPANVFVPNSALEEQQPLEGQRAEEQTASGNQTTPEMGDERPYLNSAVLPPGSELPSSNPDGSQCGELSRSSSMSSLSREVSQHFNQPPLEGLPAGTVQFYNPAQFAQTAAVPGSSRLGSRTGQRKYPILK